MFPKNTLSSQLYSRRQLNKPVIPFLVATVLLAMATSTAQAQSLIEFLYWDSVGNTVAQGVAAHKAYRAERQLWQDNIAKAKADFEPCGGCANAQAEVDKWQGVENQFQEYAGRMAAVSGMDPLVADWLGISPYQSAGYSDADRERMRYRRPDWIDQRPDYCQAPSNEFAQCMVQFEKDHSVASTVQDAGTVGSRCYEPYKLYQFCRAEDYDSFFVEVAAQEARRSGEIVPELISYARVSTVYFGSVDDAFVPQQPPREVVMAELQSDDVMKIRYLLFKEGAGLMDGFQIQRFQSNILAPGNSCVQPAQNASRTEIERRECEDLLLMGRRTADYMISCSYTTSGGSRADRHIYHHFWYDERPENAAVERLLSRSHAHPVLGLVTPRTDCPKTTQKAEAIVSQYNQELTAARLRTEQISAAIVIPEPEWLTEINARNNQAYEDSKALAERSVQHFASASFPGLYTLEISSERDIVRANCSVTNKALSPWTYIACEDESGDVYTMEGRQNGDQFQLYLNPALLPADVIENSDNPVTNSVSRGITNLGPNFSAYDAGAAFELNSGLGRVDPEQLPITVSLVKYDELPFIHDYRLIGSYRLVLVGYGTRSEGDCRVFTNDRFQGTVYEFECLMPDGRVNGSRGRSESDAPHTQSLHSWFPGPLQLGGKSVAGLFVMVASGSDPSAPGAPNLVGYADNDVTALFSPSESSNSAFAQAPNELRDRREVEANQARERRETQVAMAPAARTQRIPTAGDSDTAIPVIKGFNGIELGMTLEEAEEIAVRTLSMTPIARNTPSTSFAAFGDFTALAVPDHSEVLTIFYAGSDSAIVVGMVYVAELDEDFDADSVIATLRSSYGPTMSRDTPKSGVWSSAENAPQCMARVGQTRSGAVVSFSDELGSTRPYVPLLSVRRGRGEQIAALTSCKPVAQFRRSGRSLSLALHDLSRYTEDAR